MSTETFLVTGGNGFVASWIIKLLLDAGYRVHTTVRGKNNPAKTQHLLDLAAAAPGSLSIFEADLLNEHDFDAPLQGVSCLIHCASPFKTAGIKDAQRELVDPALLGTTHVLQAASRTPTVKRVVLTSSVVAIWGDVSEVAATANGAFTEANWNNSTSVRYQPYAYSKMLAERKAWEMAQNQQQWKLVVINPAFVFGPALGNSFDGTSQAFIDGFLRGAYQSGVPALYFAITDVREVAQAHVQAALNEQTEGRHIIAGTVASMLDIGRLIGQLYPGQFSLPTKTLPKWLMYLVGPFLGFNWRYVTNNVGVPFRVDNQKSIRQLQLNYRSLSDTLRDQIDAIQNRQS